MQISCCSRVNFTMQRASLFAPSVAKIFPRTRQSGVPICALATASGKRRARRRNWSGVTGVMVRFCAGERPSLTVCPMWRVVRKMDAARRADRPDGRSEACGLSPIAPVLAARHRPASRRRRANAAAPHNGSLLIETAREDQIVTAGVRLRAIDVDVIERECRQRRRRSAFGRRRHDRPAAAAP